MLTLAPPVRHLKAAFGSLFSLVQPSAAGHLEL